MPDSLICPLLSQPQYVVSCLRERCAFHVSVISDEQPVKYACAIQQIPLQLDVLLHVLSRSGSALPN